MKIFTLLIAVAIVVVLAAPVGADKLVLKNGKVYDGKVTKKGDFYEVTTSTSTLMFPANLVARVEKGATNEEVFAEKLAAIGGMECESAAKLYELAAWAGDNGLFKQEKTLLEKVAELDPSNADVQKKLGNVKYLGVWMPREEMYVRTGKELYDGEWIDAEVAARKRAFTASEPDFVKYIESAKSCFKVVRFSENEKDVRNTFNWIASLDPIFPGIRSAARYAKAEGNARRNNAYRRYVTLEIRATAATLDRIRQIPAMLGGGTFVIIEAPIMAYRGVKTTVICPTN